MESQTWQNGKFGKEHWYEMAAVMASLVENANLRWQCLVSSCLLLCVEICYKLQVIMAVFICKLWEHTLVANCGGNQSGQSWILMQPPFKWPSFSGNDNEYSIPLINICPLQITSDHFKFKCIDRVHVTTQKQNRQIRNENKWRQNFSALVSFQCHTSFRST